MNKQRRKSINDCIKTLESIKNNIENILSDEEYYFDNMPENLQGSIRGETSEEAIESLNDAVDCLSDCISSLEEIL